FRLINAGTVPWQDRVLVPLGPYADDLDGRPGIRSLRYVPIGAADPGQEIDIMCPLRMPEQPGTYRLCLKAAWPDGTFCFPHTFLGVVVMAVVPPRDWTAWWTESGR